MPGSAIGKTWASYQHDVIPRDAPQVQIVECRRAFYAGAWAVLQLMLRVGEQDITEESGSAYLESLLQECKAFVAKELSDGIGGH